MFASNEHLICVCLQATFSPTRSAVLSRCLVTSEKSTTIYPVLSKLQCLTEIEELASVLFGDSPLQDVLLSWQHRLMVMDANYSYTEPVLALRCTLLRFLLSVAKQQDCNQQEDYQKEIFVALRSTLAQQADRARKACQFQVGIAAVLHLRTVEWLEVKPTAQRVE